MHVYTQRFTLNIKTEHACAHRHTHTRFTQKFQPTSFTPPRTRSQISPEGLHFKHLHLD